MDHLPPLYSGIGCIHFHSKRERMGCEETLDQSKTKNQLDKLQALHLHVWCQSTLQISFQLYWLQHTSLFLQLFSEGMPQPWHLQHCGIFKATQTSLSQCHTMASLGFHTGTPLPHIWSQQLSLVTEGDSVTPSSILDSKSRIKWLKLPSSAAY